MVERTVTIRVVGDDDGAKRALLEIQRLKDKVSGISDIRVRANTGDATRSMDRLGAKLHRLSEQAIRLKLDDTAAKMELDRVKAELRDIASNWQARVSIEGYEAAKLRLDELG